MSPVLIKGLIAAGGIGLGGVGIWQFNEYMTPKTIREKLERDGESFYSFDEGRDSDQWKVLAKSYKSGGNNAIEGLTITNDDPNSDEIKKFKDECKKLGEKDLGEDSAQDMGKVKKWCTVPRASNGGSNQT